jgi:hypothetical protein
MGFQPINTDNLLGSSETEFFAQGATVASYAQWLMSAAPVSQSDRRIRLIARTPHSAAAGEVLGALDHVRSARLRLQMVFTEGDELDDVVGLLAQELGAGAPAASLRCIRFRNASPTGEQLLLGNGLGWAQDLRDDRQQAEICCEALGSAAAKAASLAFRLLWDVSEPAPQYAARKVRGFFPGIFCS